MARHKAAVSDRSQNAGYLELPSLMQATNGGGSVETVAGFNPARALTAGFPSSRVSGPTFLSELPDGASFTVPGQSRLVGRTFAPRRGKAENVLGFDDRVLVADTTGIPWRCICHLEITYETGAVGLGSGWLVSQDTVVTAAHCLFDREGKRRARTVRVIPGRSGASAPYGFFVSKHVDWPEEWEKSRDSTSAERYDFGIVKLEVENLRDEPIGQRLGYFGLRVYDKAQVKDLEMLIVNNAGYPYEPDKPYGTLWFNAGRVSSVGEAFIEYMIDTEGGQSGSPIFFFDKSTNSRLVVAIHTTGSFVNRGMRITRDVFDWISQRAGRRA
jgi:V8-like Glu-specific endopeptidase